MVEEMFDTQESLRDIQTYSAKCQGCGASMVFDPETQSLKCPHCGSKGEVEKNYTVIENDIRKGFAEAEKWNPDEQVTYKCGNCGAVVVMSVDEEASICPFCKATHIAKDGSFQSIRPHMVIPFQFSPQKATEFSKKWARRRLLAPRKFKKNINVDQIKGVYEPCFTFDSNTKSTYHGRVGNKRTRTIGSGKNRRTEVYIVYRNVAGDFERFFDDVLIATNENFDQKELNKLSPFRTDMACVYESKFLSGFMADGYRKNLDESWADAKDEIERRIRDMIISRLHCDVVDYLSVSTTHSSVTFKYLLVPVYSMFFRYKKKDYSVRVNGSTGKVRGKTPISPLRTAIASLLGVGAVILTLVLLAGII
ncbi:MAG: hypothetical protein IKA99_04625 [Clostridia bacterium]|nr:hypothetical protein [Clostridia bacterium]